LIARGGREAVFSPRGDRIAFTQGKYSPDLKVYLLPLTGGSPTLVTQASGGCFHPVFSPDGKAIYYFTENDSKYSLWRVGIDGSHPKEIVRSELLEAPIKPK
jgi:Tol biopolymer transport system component